MRDHCIAPHAPGSPAACSHLRAPGSLFCRAHEAAPAAQRGGWLSAEKRRRKLAASSEEVLDASCITPPSPGSRSNGSLRSLWVGGKPPFDRDLPGLDVLALCARELQPDHVAFHGYVIRCPLPDAELSSLEVRYALQAAKLIADSLAVRRRVLVTCAQGINRSALVASLALARVTRLSADDLIRVMRSRRHPSALFNPHFQGLLRQFVRR